MENVGTLQLSDVDAELIAFFENLFSTLCNEVVKLFGESCHAIA